MSFLTVELPLPPSANALFKNNRQGGRSLTATYSAWRNIAIYEITMEWRRLGRSHFAPPLAITISANIQGRKRDLGNLLKPIEDAFVKAIDDFPDDRWNDRITLARTPIVSPGRVVVEVKCIPDTG